MLPVDPHASPTLIFPARKAFSTGRVQRRRRRGSTERESKLSMTGFVFPNDPAVDARQRFPGREIPIGPRALPRRTKQQTIQSASPLATRGLSPRLYVCFRYLYRATNACACMEHGRVAETNHAWHMLERRLKANGWEVSPRR